MSEARNNHYVPKWYQERFLEVGRQTFVYLNMKPPQRTLSGGRVITEKAKFHAHPSRAFEQRDLYSTFFGTSVSDEIERRLFGAIDSRGSKAIPAFTMPDVTEWHRHFRTLFEYIDIQKIRTPKGLDWLKAQYPDLTQNELMFEMQGIRMMHCTIWTEGVREIVSAEDSDVKFILSDHPVTIYNHAVPPEATSSAYPNDPSIVLRASQTIFPLSRNHCLILTNLEYARDPSTNPLDKRTFARSFRNSMVRTDAFIRTRRLSPQEVAQINYVLKARARQYVGAGREEWLYPEKTVSGSWSDLRSVLLPPEDQLWHFGGEMYARFEDGRVYYQDEFGRTEKQSDFLKKQLPAKPLRPGEACGCGSGRPYKACCKSKPVALRATWTELSIRERNLLLYNGIANVLDFKQTSDWTQIRRDLTDEKISEIYKLYQALWPLETDLLQLLPKPDGVARAVYTGYIHPEAITEFALGASLYFGELLIQHPFLHAGTVKKEFSPVESPSSFRQEFLKAVLFVLTVMPLVDAGLINLIPDPCNFDHHLRDQMFEMAKARASGIARDPREAARMEELLKQDFLRTQMSLPPDALRYQISRTSPDLDEAGLEEVLQGIGRLKEHDPLADLKDGTLPAGEKGGRMHLIQLAPNFEMAMYLAQATGSCIVTDSVSRWNEIVNACRQRESVAGLDVLAQKIRGSSFAFPQDVDDIAALALDKSFAVYPALMRDLFKYLSKLSDRGPKPNFEAHVTARFGRTHVSAQTAIKKAQIGVNDAQVSCVFPLGGIQDNTVNRLLLMSSSDKHLQSVPMAFFIEGHESR